jgi:hypothetical protein
MTETTHPAVEEPFSPVDFIIAYEGGELFEDDIVEGFQRLVESGLVWQLQGHYARTAVALIEQGLVSLSDAPEPEAEEPEEQEPESHLPEGYANALDPQTEADALAAHLTRIAF